VFAAHHRLVQVLASVIYADRLVRRLKRLSLHPFPAFNLSTLLSLIVTHLMSPFLVDANSTAAHVEHSS